MEIKKMDAGAQKLAWECIDMIKHKDFHGPQMVAKAQAKIALIAEAIDKVAKEEADEAREKRIAQSTKKKKEALEKPIESSDVARVKRSRKSAHLLPGQLSLK